MKTTMLIVASALAFVAFGGTGARAQGNSDACHNQYGACMERCSQRPQSLQESCSTSCEANTNVCYSQMYGPKTNPVGALQSGQNEASDARDEAKPDDRSAAKAKKKR